MENTRSNNVVLIAILLSLLLHTSLMLYVLMQKTAHRKLHTRDNPIRFDNIIKIEEKEEPLQNVPEEKEEKKDWVTITAGTGNPEKTTTTSVSTPLSHVVPQETQEKASLSEEKDLSQPTIPLTEKNSEIPENHASDDNAIALQNTANFNLLKKKRRTRKKRTQQQQSFQTNSMFSQTGNKKPSLTLAQLTHGFLNHLEGKGSHRIPHEQDHNSGHHGLVSMLGTKIGLPHEEQIKYERYFEKLCRCIEDSLTIYRDRAPYIGQEIIVEIAFTLYRDGTPPKIAIAKSSGIMLFDNFVLFIFKDASTSFPPIPRYLKDDPFSHICVFPFSALLHLFRR